MYLRYILTCTLHLYNFTCTLNLTSLHVLYICTSLHVPTLHLNMYFTSYMYIRTKDVQNICRKVTQVTHPPPDNES